MADVALLFDQFAARQCRTFKAEVDAGVPAEPTMAWTADDLGLVISEAVSNHNDVDGVAWKGVARDVADALGIALATDAEAAARHCRRLIREAEGAMSCARS